MAIEALAGMVFTLMFTGLIGGFIVIYPLTKQLGRLMESKMQSDKDALPRMEAEMRLLAESVSAMEAELHMLKERQVFTENLLTARESRKLP